MKSLQKLALLFALATVPLPLLTAPAYAQEDAQQRAYQAGYQNGVNDRIKNKPLNLSTSKWHGERLYAYQQGYQTGYDQASRDAYGGYRCGDGDRDRDDQHCREYNTLVNGSAGSGFANRYSDGAARGAYQAGFNNGVNDRMEYKPLNLRTSKWHGSNLQAYQRGYEDGYNGVHR